jgi:hypothetical protein
MQGGGQGLNPEALNNLASTAGSVAKYTLLYQALFGLQAIMQDTLQEAMDMSDSLRDLRLCQTEAGFDVGDDRFPVHLPIILGKLYFCNRFAKVFSV